MRFPLSHTVNTALLFCAVFSVGAQERYHQHVDSTPLDVPILQHIENAEPRYEPLSLSGNKDYRVYGKQYSVWRDIKQYQVDGVASWYGEKFHGYRTSNGEIYNMYSMSAAHKNLPLPSYVKVTNKKNGNSVIVRVNDRGPFHANREIDLSYAAAYKLDMLQAGTAEISLTLINVEPGDHLDQAFTQPKHYFLQLAALAEESAAKQRLELVKSSFSLPGQVESSGNMHRLRLGPFNYHEAQEQLERVKKLGYPKAFMLKL